MPIHIAQPEWPDLSDELLARWRQVPVAVAVDLAPERQISPMIRPLRAAGQQPRLCARAVTVQCDAPDFGAVLKALEHVAPGQVLVIEAGAHADNAMIGDVLGGFLYARGAAGIICNGAIRDTGPLAAFEGFSVYSRHVNPRGPVGAARGSVNMPVSMTGVTIRPGDLILGDDDGLVALGPENWSTLIERAEAKIHLEADWTRQLSAGAPVGSIFGLD